MARKVRGTRRKLAIVLKLTSKYFMFRAGDLCGFLQYAVIKVLGISDCLGAQPQMGYLYHST